MRNDYLQCAKQIFGDSSVCKSDIDDDINSICPVLSIYGEKALCDCMVEGEVNKRRFSFAYLVKVYKSEWRKKISDWGFVGCVLKIENQEIVDTIFGYSGKIFRRINLPDMVKNERIRNLRIYSLKEQLSEKTERQVKQYRKWIEDELCYYFSCAYAILMKPGVVEIIFWEPDLNSVEDELEFVKEILNK